MYTDVTLLPVYNSLYELGLGEKEIEKILTKSQKLEGSHFVYNFLANDTFVRLYPHHGWRRTTGIELIPYDKTTKKTLYSKDYRGNVEIKALNDYILPNSPCYTIQDIDENFILKNIDLISLDNKEQNIVWDAARVILFVNEDRDNPVRIQEIITDLEQIKKLIREKFKNSFFFERYIENATRETSAKDLLSWAFDTTFLKESTGQVSTLRSKLQHIFQITDIAEKNNTRLVICKRGDTHGQAYYGYSSLETAIIIADCDNPCYDYLDYEREFFAEGSDICGMGGYYSKGFDVLYNLPKLFLLNKEVKASHDPEVYTELLNQYALKKAILVDSLSQEAVIKRLQRKRDIAQEKNNKESTLIRKLKDKLKTLTDTSGQLSLNGIKVTKHSIEYEEEKLKCDQLDMVELVAKYASYSGLDNFNWDNLSDTFFDTLTNKVECSYIKSLELTGKIGDVDFKIQNKISQNSSGALTRLVYINGFRIKKDELGEICKRGMCFDTQEAFDSFTKQVSRCSLNLHRYLNEGVILKVYDDYKNKHINFKIPLVRRKNKNYIVLGDREYSVSNTQKIIKLSEVSSMHEVINTLLNPKVVHIDGPEDIAHIIRKGTELHQKDKNKNKKLIEKIEKLFNLDVVQITNNGEQLRGYLIKGNLKKYFLDIGNTDKETIFDRLRVFSYPDMQYVCMIDKTVQQTGPSNLINRIYALHNDSLIARDVGTLTKK